jgi:hypothetical protein
LRSQEKKPTDPRAKIDPQRRCEEEVAHATFPIHAPQCARLSWRRFRRDA